MGKNKDSKVKNTKEGFFNGLLENGLEKKERIKEVTKGI
jgi:hypothetical protein